MENLRMKKIPEVVSEYMSKIGKLGGKKGLGVKKKRAASHYLKLSKIRRRKKAERKDYE